PTMTRMATTNAPAHALYLTNCLLVAVTNTASYSGANNASNTTPANVFQTVGAGAHYLFTNSSYLNLGTTNINPGLLSALKLRTVLAPVLVASNQIIGNTTMVLSVNALRDTNSPDLGFHYEPLDFLIGQGYFTNSTIILTNGATIGTFAATPGG